MAGWSAFRNQLLFGDFLSANGPFELVPVALCQASRLPATYFWRNRISDFLRGHPPLEDLPKLFVFIFGLEIDIRFTLQPTTLVSLLSTLDITYNIGT